MYTKHYFVVLFCKCKCSNDGVDVFEEWLCMIQEPDIVVFGFQEVVDLDVGANSASTFAVFLVT